MANGNGAANSTEMYAVNCEQDWCWTPTGSGESLVPYECTAKFDLLENFAKSVRFAGCAAGHVASHVAKVVGNGTGTRGVLSGVVEGYAHARTHCSTLRTEDKWVFREGHLVHMNCASPQSLGNSQGRLVCMIPSPPPRVRAAFLVFDRGDGTLELDRGDGQPPEVFDASNNTKNPGGNPLEPEANGPAPNGVFSLGEWYTRRDEKAHDGQANGEGDNRWDHVNNSYGEGGAVPVDLPPTQAPDAGGSGARIWKRTGVLIHAGRANIADMQQRKTMGCIRTTEEAMAAIKEAEPTYIIIRD